MEQMGPLEDGVKGDALQSIIAKVIQRMLVQQMNIEGGEAAKATRA